MFNVSALPTYMTLSSYSCSKNSEVCVDNRITLQSWLLSESSECCGELETNSSLINKMKYDTVHI